MANPGLYRQFIMVSTQTPEACVGDFYVGVPLSDFMAAFDGFEAVEEKDLPKVIDTLHIADATTDEFTESLSI